MYFTIHGKKWNIKLSNKLTKRLKKMYYISFILKVKNSVTDSKPQKKNHENQGNHLKS